MKIVQLKTCTLAAANEYRTGWQTAMIKIEKLVHHSHKVVNSNMIFFYLFLAERSNSTRITNISTGKQEKKNGYIKPIM